jgi:hypothetical protein
MSDAFLWKDKLGRRCGDEGERPLDDVAPHAAPFERLRKSRLHHESLPLVRRSGYPSAVVDVDLWFAQWVWRCEMRAISSALRTAYCVVFRFFSSRIPLQLLVSRTVARLNNLFISSV